ALLDEAPEGLRDRTERLIQELRSRGILTPVQLEPVVSRTELAYEELGVTDGEVRRRFAGLQVVLASGDLFGDSIVAAAESWGLTSILRCDIDEDVSVVERLLVGAADEGDAQQLLIAASDVGSQQ